MVCHLQQAHFFGLPIILDRFPRAKAVAMPGAIEVMQEQTALQVSVPVCACRCVHATTRHAWI